MTNPKTPYRGNTEAAMKLLQTLRVVSTLALARTFGRYVNSGWNGDFEYARYEWRGQEWCIPLSPCDP